jgi:hypothetical protein
MSRIRQPASRTLLLILRVSTGIFAQILTTGATGRHSIPPDCDRSGRVLGSILFLSSFHLGDAERDNLKNLLQVRFTHRGYPDSILVNV